MRLWSKAFRDGEQIPLEYTKDGWNKSPPLEWADAPRDTRELALIFEGITPGTQKPWVHWLVYNIPADARALPSGYKHKSEPEEPVPIPARHQFLGQYRL